MQSMTCLKFGVLAVLILCTVPSSAIQCYSCNSYLDQTCDDPFRQTLNDSTALIDCNKVNDGRNYTFCRKTIQTAITYDAETIRIIRSCGFLEEYRLAREEGDDPAALQCYRRTGTHGVELLYCACYADGCNSANANMAGLGLLLFLSLVACRNYFS